MAAWGDRLSDETIRDLASYVRSLALDPQLAVNGLALMSTANIGL